MSSDPILISWNFAAILAIIIFIYLWIRSRRPSDLPPGPATLPILGNLLSLKGGDLRKVSETLRKKYGAFFSLSLGPHWVVFVNGMDALKEVFVKHADYFSDRPDVFFFTHIKAKKGIAAAHPWKDQRNFTVNLLRGFGFGNRTMESTIVEEAKFFLEAIENEKGKPISIHGTINKAVSNVICSIVFGKRFSYDDKEFNKFVHAITETVINKYIPKVNLLPFLRYVPGDVFRVQHCTDQNEMVRQGLQRYIDEHRDSLDENDIRDFIDAYLIEIRKHKQEKDTLFTEDNLKYVVLDLFSAGTETTATTILWAVSFLVNHPEVQENIRTELKENIPNNRLPKLADKSNLPYCESVIAETQRLGNILPMSLPHTASEDVIVGGFKIPKGAVVIPNIDSVMHDESTFPDSYKFDPTRFLDKDGQFLGSQNILPFSLGKRVCLGESLARMELFLFFTTLVHKFKILPEVNDEPPVIQGRLGVLYEPEPIQIRFVEIE